MAKSNVDALDIILHKQREKNPGANFDKSSIEESILAAASSSGGTISKDMFKQLLSGGEVSQQPANIIEMAQDIKKLAENSEVQTVQTIESADNIENTTNITEITNSNIEQIAQGIDEIVKIETNGMPTAEEKAEELALTQDQVDVLKQIELNTTPKTGAKEADKVVRDPASGSSSLLAGAAGFLGGGVAGLLGSILSTGGTAVGGIATTLIGGITTFISTIFKTLLKGTVITMVVGGLISGILDGMEEYKKSGSIKEALWKGLVGFTEFLSFGLIDEQDLKDAGERIKEVGVLGFMIESVVAGIKGIIEFVTGTQLYKDLKAMYDEIGLASMIGEGVRQILDLIFGQGQTDKFLEDVGKLYDGVVEPLKAMYNSVSESVTGIFESIVQVFNNMYDKMISFIPEWLKPKMDVTEVSIDSNKHTRNMDFSETEIILDNTHKIDKTQIQTSYNASADKLMSQTESNNALKDAIMSNPAPVIVNAPTTNTSMQHTTALPNIKARDDSPKLFDTYGNAGAMW